MTVPFESWDTRIHRAEELACKAEATREILTFYAKLLHSQKEVDEFLRSRRGWLPSGSLADDLPVVRECLPLVLRTVESNGPAPLAEEARTLITADSAMLDGIEIWSSCLTCQSRCLHNDQCAYRFVSIVITSPDHWTASISTTHLNRWNTT
jgi:hypothetical protein